MDINIVSATIVPSICNSHELRSNRIGLLPGDPSGIGPELVASLLFGNKTIAQTEILIIGIESVLLSGAITVISNLKYIQNQLIIIGLMNSVKQRKSYWIRGG